MMCQYDSMKVLTQYSYERQWRPTSEAEALQLIEEELGDADPKGVWAYVKAEIAKGRRVTVGACRFKGEQA
jgi:hypothetical protein